MVTLSETLVVTLSDIGDDNLADTLKGSVTLLVAVSETILDIISDLLGDTYREEK